MSADDDSTPEESEAEMGQGGADRLADRLDALYQYVESLEETVADLESTVETLRTELDSERQQRRELEQQLTERMDALDERTDMLSLVEEVQQADGRQRSVALLQHLRREAEQRQRNGKPAKAGLDRDAAAAALHYPDVDRTTIYDDMQRAARLVGDEDVCWYAGGELRLDLTGDVVRLPRPGRDCGGSTTESKGVRGQNKSSAPSDTTELTETD